MTNALACLAQSGGLKRASGCLILGRELQRAACALASAARLLRRAHLHAHPHTRACAPAPALTNTCIHTHSHNTCAHKCAHCTQEGMHAQIHTHAHARTHAHIQTCMQARDIRAHRNTPAALYSLAAAARLSSPLVQVSPSKPVSKGCNPCGQGSNPTHRSLSGRLAPHMLISKPPGWLHSCPFVWAV